MTRGERIIAFIEGFCPVPEGKHVGKPINQMASDPRTINGAAKASGQARTVMDFLEGSDLIAMPERRN